MWIDPKEDEKQSVSGQPANGGDLSIGAGGGAAQPGVQSSTGTTGNPSTINPIQSNQPTQKFASVQDYLGANKQQGEDLGQKFTTNLTDTANNERSTIDTAANQAQNEVSSNTPIYNSDLISKAASNPTEITKDPGQLDSFLKQWNAAYSGPSSFESSNSYAPAVTATNEAGQKAAEVGTAGGQQQLLQDQFNVYGQGNKGLDQALLQNSSYYPTVQAAVPAFKSVQDYLANKAKDVNTNIIPQAQQTAESTAKQTQDTVKAAEAGLPKKILDRLSTMDLQGIPAADRANFLNALTGTIKQSGLDPNQVYTETLATPEDYANARAYGQLTGTGTSVLPQQYENQLPTTEANSTSVLQYLRNQARRK